MAIGVACVDGDGSSWEFGWDAVGAFGFGGGATDMAVATIAIVAMENRPVMVQWGAAVVRVIVVGG